MTDEQRFLPRAAATHSVDVSSLEITRIGTHTFRGHLSALRYGPASTPTQVVFVHGGGLNAHSWDLVAAELAVPAVAVDLPGHGHSDWFDDHDYRPRRCAVPVEEAVRRLAPRARLIVGMSLGGMVAIPLVAHLPSIEHLVLVDVSPGAHVPAGSAVGDIMGIRPAPFEEFLCSVSALSGGRDTDSLRHSVWHATTPTDDGLRRWRTDPQLDPGSFTDLWPDLEQVAARTTAVLATRGSFVPAEDHPRLTRMLTPERVIEVEGAGHAVQSSRPKELSALLLRTIT